MIILALLNSHVANYYLKVMNPTINFPPGYIQSVPFSNECRNLKVSKLSEECISHETIGMRSKHHGILNAIH